MFAASKSGRAAAVADPYFPYVPLLLDTTSTDGQNNQGTTTTNGFLDSSSNNFTITRNGTPTQGSVTPYWPNGYWSNNFNGSNSYLSITNSASLNPGTGNFTLEYWVYFNALTQGNIYDGTSNGVAIALNASSQFAFGQSNVAFLLNDTVAAVTGQWYHIAISRSGTTLSLFKNGTRVATATNSTNFVSSTANRIGWNGVSAYLNGYVSNLRLIIGGTPIYDPTQTTITVPTSPLTAITNTALLTCQSNRFIDNGTANSGVGFPITVNGTPKVQTFQPFSPTASYTAASYGGSGYFNGSTDYLSLADNSALQLSTGDFTIEGWFYISGSTSTAYNLISKGTASTGWSLNTTTGARIQFSYTASNLTGATTTLVQGAWYHIAVVRSGSSAGNLKIYINGVQEVASAGAVTDNFNQTSVMYVSASRTATVPLNGYSSNIRIVKGTAVYTAAFTPPTTPLTAITNTSLLTNFTNAGIYDAAVQNNAITVGDAQASTTQYKWSPTSMKFDGTVDALSIPSSTAFGLGTGDWTIEFWVYLNATTTQTLVSMLTTAASVAPHIYYQSASGIRYYTNSADRITGGALTTGVWNYIAVTKASGTTRMYINGTQTGSNYTDGNNYGTTNPFAVGDFGVPLSGTLTLNGYVQDVRITRGFARTVTTTPTAAFPTR